MIISRTPYRISFFGGGTDYPEWYFKNGGEVISTTINKYLYLSCRALPPFYKYKYRIIWKKIELANNKNEIEQSVVQFALCDICFICLLGSTSRNCSSRQPVL